MKQHFDSSEIPKSSAPYDKMPKMATSDEPSMDEMAALYQVGNQNAAGYGEAANAEVFNAPESEANLYKLDQQEVGVAANDEVFGASANSENFGDSSLASSNILESNILDGGTVNFEDLASTPEPVESSLDSSEILPAQKNEESEELNLTFDNFSNKQASAEELDITFNKFNEQQALAEEAENQFLTRNESAVSEVIEAGADENASTETVGEGEVEALGDAEVLSESLEAFNNAKAQYEDLKAQIEENNFQAHFLYEMQSAAMNIQAAEYAAQNDGYTKERKDEKAANATNFLNNLSSRLTAELARLKPEPSYVDLMETVTVNSELDKNPQVDIPPVESINASTTDAEVVPMTETESVPVTVTETTSVEEAQTTPVAAETNPVVTAETAPIPEAVEALPIVPMAEAVPLVATAEKSPEATEAALTKYQEKRAEWREYNKIFKKTESEYKAGLADYYERRGGLEIMRTGARSLLGLEPKFPAEVAELQARYSEAKKFYALEFSKVLALRGEAHEGNADYSLNRKEMKRGMAQKFILKPAEQLLDLQKETALAESERSTTKKVMGLMAKHKWGVRVGTIVLAGAVGLASGGASVAFAAAGSRAVRMAAGMAGGALAGAGVNRAMKGYAETGEKNVISAEANARENFDLANLDELEAELLSAQADRGTRNARRTAATVLAAGAAGFGSGMMAAEVPLGVPVAPVVPIETAEVIPGNEYVVESGDNLWNIMRTEYADALKGLPPDEQNRVLAELFERAKTDVALRESIGLRDSNNLGLIYPDQKLELQGLGNELQEIINQGKPEAVPAISVASLERADVGSYATPDAEVFLDNNGEEIITTPSASDETFAPRPYSADGNYFALPEYREFALGAMGGVEQITASINEQIDLVEGKQDVFEALQGRPRVYDTLKNLTVGSLTDLGRTPGGIENFAIANGVDENMVREWLHNFDQIKRSDLPRTDTTRFGDLFTRSVIENQVTRV